MAVRSSTTAPRASAPQEEIATPRGGDATLSVVAIEDNQELQETARDGTLGGYCQKLPVIVTATPVTTPTPRTCSTNDETSPNQTSKSTAPLATKSL